MIDRRDRQLGDGQRLDAPDDWLDPPDDGVGSGARGPVDGPSWIGSGRLEPDPPPSTTWLVVGLVAAVALVGLGYWLVSSGDAEPEPTAAAEPPAAPETDIPPVLLAAEAWVADPGSETLRTLLDAVGGFDGVEIGVAEGAFDLVTFDPNDNGRLLATLRNSYGPAENQADNELWTIDDGAVTQAIWNPSVEHDFVHFNPDGTISMWVRSGDTFDFSPRDSIVMDTGRSVLTRTTDPFFPARFAADAGTVFALVSDVPSSVYTALIADDGEVQTVLADGNPYEWVDVPTTGIVIAYPADDTGTTAVWDTQTFDRIDDHVLASRSIVRVAVSADGLIAVGIGSDGSLEVIDMVTGSVTRRFGAVDSAGIQQPISLNDDGSVAVTIDRDGTVSMWFVADGEVVASRAGSETAATRWLSEALAARLSSAVAPDASRVAIRVPAIGTTPVTWVVLDTDAHSWVQRACDLAGRALTDDERTDLGLAPSPGACG